MDVGTPVNKTESAYIKYISKSDTPKTPQEGKTATEAMKNKYNITDEAYLDYTPKELMNISEKMTDFKDIK